MSSDVIDVSENADENGLVASIMVHPGEGYFLLIDNFYKNTTAFQLEWFGTASRYLNCEPQLPCSIVANAGGPYFVCEENEIQLSGSAYGVATTTTYQWLPGNLNMPLPTSLN